MKRVQIGVLILLLLVLFSINILAEPTQTACEEDLYCILIYEEGSTCQEGFCDIDENQEPENNNQTPLANNSIQNNSPLNQTNNTNQSNLTLDQEQNDLLEDQITFNDLIQDDRLTALEDQVLSIQDELAANTDTLIQIQESQSQNQDELGQIRISAENANIQSTQLREDVRTQVNTLSTGMAGLQQGLDATKNNLNTVQIQLTKEQKITTVLTYIFFILLAIVIALFVILYLNRPSSNKPVLNPQIINYITKHIKNGKKYPLIKENLLKAGWSLNEIDWAYKETLRHNYKRYKETNSDQNQQYQQTNLFAKSEQAANAHFSTKDQDQPNQANGFDARKVGLVAFIAIFVIAVIFLVFKGVGTGQAIHFLNDQDFENSSFNLLAQNIENNQFYPLLEQFNGCVEIQDGDKFLSFQIQKTAESQLIKKTNISCSNSEEFDFAVKFTSYEAFEEVFSKMTCSSFKSAHKPDEITGERKMYILPSKYVLAGFRINQQEDYSPYCSVLQKCLTQEELNILEISCI